MYVWIHWQGSLSEAIWLVQFEITFADCYNSAALSLVTYALFQAIATWFDLMSIFFSRLLLQVSFLLQSIVTRS
jgi:hypothetical protein